jgi:hypothetical protein
LADIAVDGPKPKNKEEQYVSTSYSNTITCGACGAPLKNVPVMYEHMNIDWRCGKCLRRDKPGMEGRIS